MKKIFRLLVVFALIFLLVNCVANRNPKDVVDVFMTSLQQYDWDAMSDCIDNGETTLTSKLENPFKATSETDMKFLNYLKEGNAKMTYEIVTIEAISNDLQQKGQKNQAFVTVNVRYLDYMPILKSAFVDSISNAFTNVFGGKKYNEAELMDLFIQNLDSTIQKSPEFYKDATLKFYCVKVGREWKIANVPEGFDNVATCNVLNSFTELFTDFINKSK